MKKELQTAPLQCNSLGVVFFQTKNMNKQKARIVGAETALLATMVEVAIAGLVPEYRELAIALSIPFMIYGLFHVLVINK